MSQLADRVDLLNTIWAKLDIGGEELNTLILVQRAVDEGRLNNTSLALGSLQQALSKSGTGHGHGQSCRACTILGLDDFVTAKLNAVDQGVQLVASDVTVARLGDQGNDGDARVAADDCDVLVRGISALDLGDESRCSDNIEGCDTKEALGVVDSL